MTAMSLLPERTKRVLITGDAGFIGGALVRRLLADSKALVFYLDKFCYASDITSIGENPRHELLKVDLIDPAETLEAFRVANPDLVMYLAAESLWIVQLTTQVHLLKVILMVLLTFCTLLLRIGRCCPKIKDVISDFII